jgi:hypothetical protein
VLLSCEKNPNNNDSIVFNYSIVYHDFNPDIDLTSTFKYEPDTFIPPLCYETPYPSDSTAQYYLDVNKDGIDDFLFTVKRWVYFGVGSSFHMDPCLCYQNYSTRIISTNDSNKICIKNYAPFATEFLNNDIISSDSSWASAIRPLYNSSIEHQFFYAPNNSEYYLGIQVYKENRFYYGWILVGISKDNLILKEYAINISENLNIKAGQKQ